LRPGLPALTLDNIKTYIQSGNVVFDSPSKSPTSLARSISKKVGQEHGFEPQVLILGLEDLQHAIGGNPFPAAVSDPGTLHFSFLERPATNPDVQTLDAIRTSTESYRITDGVFYLHAPDGVARSKLAARAEKCLGVATTLRNYRTVEKLMALVLE